MEHPYNPEKRKELFLDLAMLKYLELVAEDFKTGKLKEVEIKVKEVMTDRYGIVTEPEGRKKQKMKFDPSIESRYIESRVKEYKQPKKTTAKYLVGYYDNLTGDVYDKNVFVNTRIEIFNFFQQWKNYNSSLLLINDKYFEKEDFLAWLYKIEQEIYGYKINYHIRDEWDYVANATIQMPSGDPAKSDNFITQNTFLSSLIKRLIPRTIETILTREGFINNNRTTIDITTYDSDGKSGIGAYVLPGLESNKTPMNFDLSEVSWDISDGPDFLLATKTTYHEMVHVFQGLSNFITDSDRITGISKIRSEHPWFVEAHASFVCGDVYRRMTQEISPSSLSLTLGRPPTVQELKDYIENYFNENISKKYFSNSYSDSLWWYSWCGLGLAFVCKKVLENNKTWKDFIKILTIENDLDSTLTKIIPDYTNGVESFKEDFETNGASFCFQILWKSYEAEAEELSRDFYGSLAEKEAILPEGIFFTGESFLNKYLIPEDDFGIQPIEESKSLNQIFYDINQEIKHSGKDVDYILLLIHDNDNLTLNIFENADKIISDKEVYIIVINSGIEPSEIPEFDSIEKKFHSKNNINYASIKYDKLYLVLDALPQNADAKDLKENKFNGNNLLITGSPV